MNRAGFRKMLVVLASNYNHALQKERLDTLTNLAEQVYGFDHNWAEVTKKVVTNETFFPNIATFKKYVQPKPDLESNEDKAMACVDRFIAYLSGAIEHEDVSEHDLSYCRRKFNVDRFSFVRGQINLDFKRKEWIQMVKADFDYGQTRTDTQIESAKVLELIKGSSKEF